MWRGPSWAHMIRFWICTAANPGRHRLQAAVLLKHNHPLRYQAAAEAGREPHLSSGERRHPDAAHRSFVASQMKGFGHVCSAEWRWRSASLSL